MNDSFLFKICFVVYMFTFGVIHFTWPGYILAFIGFIINKFKPMTNIYHTLLPLWWIVTVSSCLLLLSFLGLKFTTDAHGSLAGTELYLAVIGGIIFCGLLFILKPAAIAG